MQPILVTLSGRNKAILSMLCVVIIGCMTWFAGRMIQQWLDERTVDAGRVVPSAASKILQREKLVVGIRNNVAPFGFIAGDGTLSGFDVDISREIARRWLGDEEALDLKIVTAANKIPMLLADEVDLLVAALPSRRDRDALIDFSETYFMDSLSLLTRTDSNLTEVDDLEGRVVATIADSHHASTIQEEANQAALSIIVKEISDFAQALDALATGGVDAIAANNIALIQLARGNPGLQVISTNWAPSPYSIGLRQGDSHIRALLNFTLEDMMRDGTYELLSEKWFVAESLHRLQTSPGEWSYELSQLPQESVQTNDNPLDVIRERRHIVAGVSDNVFPFGFRDDGGEWQGFDIDIIRELAKRWLGDETAFELVPGEIFDHVTSLSSGEIDLVAAGMIKRREWFYSVDFSQHYLGPPIVNEPLGIAIRQNQPAFRELLNFTLQEMKRDGIYDTLHTRWFGPDFPTYPVEMWPGDAGYLLTPYLGQAVPVRISAPRDSTIRRIRQRGNILQVGVANDKFPFGFIDESGKLDGFDVELTRALADYWGLQIHHVAQSSAAQIPQLLQGNVDLIAAGLVHDRQRERELDFSQTYFVNGLSLLTPQTDIIDATDYLKRVATQEIIKIAVPDQLSIQDQVQAFLDRNGWNGELLTYQALEEAESSLLARQVDAVVAEYVALTQIIKDRPAAFRIGQPFATQPLALGLTAGDSHFQQLVNISLQEMAQNGRYAELYAKWFGGEISPYSIELWHTGSHPSFEDASSALDRTVYAGIDRLSERGQLTVGIELESNPFSFARENGDPEGVDVDLARQFAARWLGNKDAIQFGIVTPDNVGQMLEEGGIDIVIGDLIGQHNVGHDLYRSQTYYRNIYRLILPTENRAKSVAGLRGSTIGIEVNSASEELLQRVAARHQIDLNPLPFVSLTKAIEALDAGVISAVAGEETELRRFVSDSHYSFLREPLEVNSRAVGLAHYDHAFRDLINFTLQEMELDGTLARLSEQWLGNKMELSVEVWPGQHHLSLDLGPMDIIPAGSYTRGYAGGFPDERSEQNIELDTFHIDRFEVTSRQYARCVEAGECESPSRPQSVKIRHSPIQQNYPVSWVRWFDAAGYCAFVGKRLPTEAEWERAARGPGNALYPWGNDKPDMQPNFDYLHGGESLVGSFPSDVSGYGIYDMGGNVREWVADWYRWDYYTDGTAKNPPGPEMGVTKVLRGGSWNDTEIYVRSTVRRNFLPESVDANLGFRCASTTVPIYNITQE